MTMKRSKRRVALALSLCLLLSCLLPLGVSAAAPVGFSDIPDSEMAVSVEVLRLLGVAGGYADGTYRPDAPLTRAQFCKMAVMAMNKGDQAQLYRYHTIFRDVKPSHSASGYINLAVKTTQQSGGSDGKNPVVVAGIISGDASGNFYPDKPITYAQAITSLMRMLGYQDSDVGAVWPNGYLLVAAERGLSDGLSMAPSDNLTRGMAARLFARLLATNTKSGESFGASLGTPVTNVVLVSSTTTAPDGSANGLLVMEGTTSKTYKLANGVSTGLLNGRKGTLLLEKNGSGKVLTFVPTGANNSKNVTVALAKADSFTDTEGRKYTIGADVSVYYQGENKPYSDTFTFLSGQSVSITFGTNGQVEYLFTGSASVSTDAVVVAQKGSSAGFAELAGGNTNYTIYKNGLLAGVGDLRQYDVAVYNGANNSIQVSDRRLTGALENAYPNLSAPSRVTVMGHEFTVLPGAGSDFAGMKVGSPVSLLLTGDNRVAGAVEPTGSTRSNAVGIVTSVSADSATVQLLNGLELKGKHFLGSDFANYLGQLVRVSSERKDMLSLARLSNSGGSSINVADKKVGDKSFADNVQVYEKVGNGKLVQISLGQLTQETIPGAQVSYIGYDWADRVNLIIFDDVTGDTYTYGKLEIVRPPQTDNGTLVIHYDNGKSISVPGNYGLNNAGYYGFALSADGKGLAKYVELKQLKGVSNSSWTGNLINVGGITYPISSNVVCYNRTTGLFLSLSAARAWGEQANFFYDRSPNEGGKIRLIEVS